MLGLNVKFSSSEMSFNILFGEFHEVLTSDLQYYEGSYNVTPSPESQTLPTSKKVMKEDLMIKEIPFFEVSNTSGGTTIYIGEEIEYG